MNTPFDEHPRRPGLFASLRSSFLTGLVVIAPVGLTIWLIWSVIGWIDGVVLPLVPYTFQPEKSIGLNNDEFYVLLHEPHCKGFKEHKSSVLSRFVFNNSVCLPNRLSA